MMVSVLKKQHCQECQEARTHCVYLGVPICITCKDRREIEMQQGIPKVGDVWENNNNGERNEISEVKANEYVCLKDRGQQGWVFFLHNWKLVQPVVEKPEKGEVWKIKSTGFMYRILKVRFRQDSLSRDFVMIDIDREENSTFEITEFLEIFEQASHLVKDCDRCNGKGYFQDVQGDGAWTGPSNEPCDDCGGKGFLQLSAEQLAETSEASDWEVEREDIEQKKPLYNRSIDDIQTNFLQAKIELDYLCQLALELGEHGQARLIEQMGTTLDLYWFSLQSMRYRVERREPKRSFHSTEETCGSCGGPLDEHRDAICVVCHPNEF